MTRIFFFKFDFYFKSLFVFKKEILDENNGCNLSCAVMSDDNDLVIGRKEVYFKKKKIL